MISSGNSRTNLTSILVLVFLLRLGIPYGNFLLLPLLAFSLVIAIIRGFKLGLKSFVKDSLGFSYTLLLSFAILLISYLFFSNHHKILTIEIVHSLSVFVVLFVLLLLIETKEELAVFFSKLKLLIIVFSAVIGLLGVSKLILQFRGVTFDFLTFDQYPAGSSLTIDSNYFSLFILFGIVLLLSEMLYKHSWRKVSFYQAVLLILTLNVVLSTSRRGFIIALASFVLISFLSFLSFFMKKEKLLIFRSNTRFYLLSVTVVVGLGLYFLFGLSSIKRGELTAKYSFTYSFFDYISSLVFENQSVFGNDTLSIVDVQHNLWRKDFDPRYPYSGWASGNYKIVEKLEGSNVNIVPKGSVGCKIDCSYDARTWNNNSYFFSRLFNGISDGEVRKFASIYCYVSSDYDGDWVGLKGVGKLRGITSSYYDMSQKGEWQELKIAFIGEPNDEYSVNIYIEKANSISFNGMSGYVILASPSHYNIMFDSRKPWTWSFSDFFELEDLNHKFNSNFPEGTAGILFDSRSFVPNKNQNSLSKTTKFIEFKTVKGKRYVPYLYIYSSPDFNGDNIFIHCIGDLTSGKRSYYDMNKKGVWQRLWVNCTGIGGVGIGNLSIEIKNGIDSSSLRGYVIIAYPDVDEFYCDPSDPNTYSPDDFFEKVSLAHTHIDSYGFLVDKRSKGMQWRNAYYSVKEINEVITEKGDSLRAEVFCFVSNDFNGQQVRLELKGSISGNVESSYSFNKKGEWQKLSVKGLSNGGIVKNNVFFIKNNSRNFDELEGNIIFALPTLFVKKNTVWFDVCSKEFSLLEDNEVIDLNKDVNRVESEDEIQNSSFQTNNHFSGPRVVRWRYAWYLYTKEYSWLQKIIGKGHFHTEKFAKMFKKEENGYEYPHNPLLSVLLYSGILGLLAYLWLLFKVFSFYWLYKKDYWVWGLCFLATFFFSFFSANSPFDPAVMALFMVLPFLIHAKSILPSSGFNKSLINK